jgi:hypothetical protein
MRGSGAILSLQLGEKGSSVVTRECGVSMCLMIENKPSTEIGNWLTFRLNAHTDARSIYTEAVEETRVCIQTRIVYGGGGRD